MALTTSGKFYVRCVTKLNIFTKNGTKCSDWFFSYGIDTIYKNIGKMKIGTCVSYDIFVNDLFFGERVFQSPALYTKENNMIDLTQLKDGEYWFIDECIYGELEQTSGPDMIAMTFYVNNGTLCAKNERMNLDLQSIKLSDIAFYPLHERNPIGYFPYPDKDDLNLTQPIVNSSTKSSWKNIFKSITKFSVNHIDADDNNVIIVFEDPFVTVQEKPNTLVIDDMIASIISNECDISRVTVRGKCVNIVFKL